MQIAICDNSEIILKRVVSLVEDYAEYNHVDIKYQTFTSYESAKEFIDDYDLFILDYNMNDDSINPDTSSLMTGMDFAKLVRETSDPHKGVIFLTSYTDIVYEAFEVRTHRFLIKPVEKDKFFKAIDDFLKSTIDSGTILVNVNNEAHVIDVDSIYYFEVTRKDVFIHFEDSVLKCHKTISAFEDELIPFGFFRTHRSYLVNISKIETMNKKSAIMRNGEEVYVSSKKYDDLCEAFLKNKR